MPAGTVRTRIYEAIGDLLGLAGTETIAGIDLADAQPVHDLSRLAWQYPGYFTVGFGLAVAGAGTDRQALTRSSLFSASFPLEEQRRERTSVWFCGFGALVTLADRANLDQLILGVTLSHVQPNAPVGDSFPIWLSDGSGDTSQIEIVATDGSVVLDPAGSGFQPPGMSFPIFMPLDSSIDLVTLSTGAITSVRIICLMFAGPRGTTPPGMA